MSRYAIETIDLLAMSPKPFPLNIQRKLCQKLIDEHLLLFTSLAKVNGIR